MNAARGTRAALVAAGRHLFARRGYRGASIRAITARAGANLGAVTYHFGSKQALYDEVLETLTAPLAERVRAAAAAAPAPLDGVEAVVRGLLAHMAERREMPALMLHELSMDRPVPAPVRRLMREVFAALQGLIAAGQERGQMVAGDPMLLAVSAVAQPVYLGLVGARLRDVFGLDSRDAATHRRIVEHVVQSVRRSLGRSPA